MVLGAVLAHAAAVHSKTDQSKQVPGHGLVTRSQCVRLHEVPEIVEIALELSLGHLDDERLSKLEEPGRLPHDAG